MCLVRVCEASASMSGSCWLNDEILDVFISLYQYLFSLSTLPGRSISLRFSLVMSILLEFVRKP
jgi:hypothetical protein